MTKITIAIPTNRGIRPKTVESVMRLIANNSGEYEFHCICPSEGYTVAENRNYIANQALQYDSDYLLMVDDDMIFEADLLDRLIANDKAICGVAYHSRGSVDAIKIVPSDEIMAISEVDKGKYINLTTETDPKYKELFECYAVGTGIILIKTSVFTQIPRPWFEFTFDESGKCKEGEDWNFCFKAKEAGFKIYTDPTLTIGHIGDKIY